MSFRPIDLPDLRGRTAVVTGANSGLGLQTTRLLAGAGAHVVMTARSRGKYDAAVAQVLPTNRRAVLSFVELDLADLSSVAAAADVVRAEHEVVDVLVNNAGVMLTPPGRTVDGLELQLGTNHYGHFALTGRLLDLVLAAEDPRVVTVSSNAHHLGDLSGRDWHQERGDYEPAAAYSRSKLANLVFALELQRRFDAAGLTARSVAAHPGYTATNLQSAGVRLAGGTVLHRLADRLMRLANRLLAMDVRDGALPQVHAAVSDVPGGSYWGPRGFREMRGPVGPARINRRARDRATGRRLWQDSVARTGVAFDVLGG